MNPFVSQTEVFVFINSTVDRSIHVVVPSLYILIKLKILVIAFFVYTIYVSTFINVCCLNESFCISYRDH